jgi:nicotinate-nucleotide pyrophosphorylase (carboxylating)
MVGQNDRARGVFLAKSPLTLAGCDVALEAFAQIDQQVSSTFHFVDGDEVARGAIIGEITGTARALLSGERTALNFLQHLSGVATLTREFVRAGGGRITILDTRKTPPGISRAGELRSADRRRHEHRMSLDDGVLNQGQPHSNREGHRQCVTQVPGVGSKHPVEVEVTTLEEVDAALDAKADILLLDNMTTDVIREASAGVAGRAKTEISGGVTLDRIPSWRLPAPITSRAARLLIRLPRRYQLEIEPI